jgi:hypothetical protein
MKADLGIIVSYRENEVRLLILLMFFKNSVFYENCHASVLLAGIQRLKDTGCQLKARWHDTLWFIP